MGYVENIVIVNHNNKNFYELLGPVFGSRDIQNQTKDRFFDDVEKAWYISNGIAVSLKGNKIVNFWVKDTDDVPNVIAEIHKSHTDITGIVPIKYRDAFKQLGFLVINKTKNFISIKEVK